MKQKRIRQDIDYHKARHIYTSASTWFNALKPSFFAVIIYTYKRLGYTQNNLYLIDIGITRQKNDKIYLYWGGNISHLNIKTAKKDYDYLSS